MKSISKTSLNRQCEPSKRSPSPSGMLAMENNSKPTTLTEDNLRGNNAADPPVANNQFDNIYQAYSSKVGLFETLIVKRNYLRKK